MSEEATRDRNAQQPSGKRESERSEEAARSRNIQYQSPGEGEGKRLHEQYSAPTAGEPDVQRNESAQEPVWPDMQERDNQQRFFNQYPDPTAGEPGSIPGAGAYGPQYPTPTSGDPGITRYSRTSGTPDQDPGAYYSGPTPQHREQQQSNPPPTRARSGEQGPTYSPGTAKVEGEGGSYSPGTEHVEGEGGTYSPTTSKSDKR